MTGACAMLIAATGKPVHGDPGYREYFRRPRGPDAVMFDMRRISAQYTRARDTALERMRERAARLGADAVLSVTLRRTEEEVEELPVVQYVATGTAVRSPSFRTGATATPILTLLEPADIVRLRDGGHRPVGIAAATSTYFVRPSARTAQARSNIWGSGTANQELEDLSLAVARARDVCLRQILAQATTLGGEEVLGLALELEPRYGVDLHLNVHALGTIVRRANDHGGVDSGPRLGLELRD